MEILPSDETPPETPAIPENPTTPIDNSPNPTGIEEGVTLDVSGKNLELPVPENSSDDAVESLYMYKNVYSLIPKSVGGLMRLKTLKFFGNEINLFAPEFGNMTRLERLQMKVSSPGIGGLPLHKLKGLKELELSKGPSRPSAFPILTEIAALTCLTKLCICHFNIRFVFFFFWRVLGYKLIIVIDVVNLLGKMCFLWRISFCVVSYILIVYCFFGG